MARPEKKKRNELIVKLNKEGKGYKAIADMFELHPSRIYRIIKDSKEKIKGSTLSTE